MNLRKNRTLQWITVVTLGVYTGQLAGCDAPPDDVGTAGQGDREITAQILARTQDEAGNITMQTLSEERFKLGEFPWLSRDLVVDGRVTSYVADLYTGTEIVVPLNDGTRVTLRRSGNLFEIQGEARPESTSLAKMRAFALRSDGAIELFRAENLDNAAPDGMIQLNGVQDLPQTQQALSASLALQIMLGTLEDGETAIPVAAIIAIVIGGGVVLLGAAWLAVCYLTFRDCLYFCNGRNANGVDHKCGAVKVTVRGRSISTHWTLGFGCTCTF